jgi:hypothetical protein
MLVRATGGDARQAGVWRDAEISGNPVWSPDSASIAVQVMKGDQVSLQAVGRNGAGGPSEIASYEGASQIVWPHGNALYALRKSGGAHELFLYRLGSGIWRPVSPSPHKFTSSTLLSSGDGSTMIAERFRPAEDAWQKIWRIVTFGTFDAPGDHGSTQLVVLHVSR